MSNLPLRIWVGIAVSAVMALVGSILFYLEKEATSITHADYYQIEAQIRRLAPVDAELPRDIVLGYITDIPPEKIEFHVDFFGVQNGLAPRLLVVQSERHPQEWVIGSFQRRPDIAEVERTYGLSLVKRCGLGIYLFRRRG